MFSSRFQSHRRPARSGFTLIEVLVTLLLMVIVVPVILEGMSVATRSGSIARRKTEAAGLAESRLNELVATGDYQSVQSGDFGAEWPDFRWNLTVETWSSAGVQVTGLQQVTITVTWGDQRPGQSVVLSTLVRTSASGTTSGTSAFGNSTAGGGS
jgi:prepilin-type N-terminal cleavage/methylation domain-containing protein